MSIPRPEMTTAAFWAATAERAIKTAAQVAAALIGTGAVGITALDWAQIGGVAATAAVLSVLTSLASDRLGPAAGPSLVAPPTVPVAEAAAPAIAAPGPAPVLWEAPAPALLTGGVRNDIAAATDPANIVEPNITRGEN